MIQQRKSWDTTVKYLAKQELLDNFLTAQEIRNIGTSNLNRWRKEPDDKYQYNKLNSVIKQEIEFLKTHNQSSRDKKITESFIKLTETFHEILSEVKGIKSTIRKHKATLVNTIEEVKEYIDTNDAIKIFDISRGTYQNYKTKVIHACDASYFQWCTKRFPNQLLPQEVLTIKQYLTNDQYKHWSKSSIYSIGVRHQRITCCQSTFYKYSNLLGIYGNKRLKKSDFYEPVKTTTPNELWCADVTIFKTPDGRKHYIHLLVDHYSKMILGYRIESHNSGKAIKALLQEAKERYQPHKISFLTDAGTENINTTVSKYLNNLTIPTQHNIAQRDVIFSNSLIESINKILKHQFLYPKNITSSTINKEVATSISTYNTIRPQWSLQGNTPVETYEGVPMDFNKYKVGFSSQKTKRLAQNKQNNCSVCN